MTSLMRGQLVNEFEHHSVVEIGRFRVQVPRAALHPGQRKGDMVLAKDAEIQHVLPPRKAVPNPPTVFVSDTLYKRIEEKALNSAK
mgnify:CR=1 FL=1